MPSSARQPTPGPSTTTSQSHTSNCKKRAAPDADDTRDIKKAKVDGDSLPLPSSIKEKEKDKKKKKKKKKRRTSVVSASAVVVPAAREREVSKARVPPAVALKTEHANAHVEDESDGEKKLSSSDKGKEKAPSPPADDKKSPSSLDKGKDKAQLSLPRAEVVQPVASGSGTSDADSEIARLKAQLASQKSLLERHQNHLIQHQQSLTCQICLDLMHKPYALAPCGHMTCYGCLVRWFTAPVNPEAPQNAAPPVEEGIDGILNSAHARNGAYIRRRKNCPVCRAAVIDRPIEMWGIKGMVASFVKSGLGDLPLPAPVDNDNAPAVDPWRNVFRKAGTGGGAGRYYGHQMDFHRIFGGAMAPPPPPPPAAAGEEDRAQLGWYDEEDGGIYRCISCYHEIIFGRCTRCGRGYPGHVGHDDDDDDGSDFDDDPHLRSGLQRFMDGLVGRGEELDDDEDDDSAADEDFMRNHADIWHDDDFPDEDEDDHDDGGEGFAPHAQDLFRRLRNDGLFESDLEDDAEDDEDDDGIGAGPYHMAEMLLRDHFRRRGVNIAHIEDPDDEDGSDYEGSFIDDGAEHVTDDDADDDSEVEVVDGPHPLPFRQRSVIEVVDDDDEEEEEPRRVSRRRASRMTMVESDEDEDEDEGIEEVSDDQQLHDAGSDLDEDGSLSPRPEYEFMGSEDGSDGQETNGDDDDLYH